MQKNIVIVPSQFHKSKVELMLHITRQKCAEQNLIIQEEVWVSGTLEHPLMFQHLLNKKNIDGGIALGIIEKGETQHGLVMGHTVLHFLVNLQLQTKKTYRYWNIRAWNRKITDSFAA